ncbi:unnamed protein product [Durusdinium trenchii]|uniref:Uncharacterized protein n=2 Tax=Durusdinium trenchii TaxID=1381693 RepID=A0ABP0J3F7_9DINO
MPVERTAEIAASPETIWTYLGQLERWPEWDADIKSISDVQGGLVEGGSFMLHMEGVSVPITIKDLKEQQGFRWVGLAMCGCLTCEGVFQLQVLGNQRTNLEYSFGLGSCLGCVLSTVKRKEIVTGTEVGLANIKKFTEEIEASKS